MMARRYITILLLGLCLMEARAWTETLNDTGHLGKTSVLDGELGSAHSSVSYDRKRSDDHPEPFINGHNRHLLPDNLQAPLLKKGVKSQEIQDGKQDSSKPETGPGNRQEVLETQQTTCQVTTEQLVATAQATVTRVLKGLCTSQEMEARFEELVEVMTDRLSELKNVAVKLESRMEDYNEALKRGKYQQMETLVQHCDSPKPAVVTLSDAESRAKTIQDGQKTYLADLYENEASGEEESIREPEIHKYNSSIHLEPSMAGAHKKVFTYYWKIRQIRYKLTEWNPRRSFRSQSFYIYPGGYRMYLRSYPRQNSTNFFLHVGVTKGDFDQALKWPFPLKMKVAILDQTRNTRMFEDVTSRVWDPSQLCSEFNWQQPTKGDNYECVGLGFPHDILHQRGYIFSDSIVTKLSVYLDQ